MQFNIPEIYIEGFELFIRLGDEVRESFVKEIAQSAIGLPPKVLCIELSEKFSLKINDTEKIIEMIISLVIARETSQLIPEAFVEGVFTALVKREQSLEDSAKMNPSLKLKSQLISLLDAKGSFYLTIKANDLITEREKILLQSRVLTDLRPIFTDGTDCELKGAIVIHTLKIEYKEDNRTKEIHFALDQQDLKKLSEFIDRAEQKEKLIHQSFKSIPIIKTENNQ